MHSLRYVFRGHEQAGFFAHALQSSETRDLISRMPGNTPPAEGPYICLIPVLDYWRIDKSLAERNSVRHYANEIEPAILEDVRTRRCALVFDLSNEGPAYSPGIFGELFRWMAANQLPPGQVVWLAQNRAMEAACHAAAGPHADWIRFEYYDFFVKMIAVLFAPGGHEAGLGGDLDASIGHMFDERLKDRLLLCLNATPRLPRVLTVSALIHHGLLEESLVSFPGMNYQKGGQTIAEVEGYVAAHPSLSYLKPSLDVTFGLNGLTVDSFAEQGNALFNKIDVHPYERTFFSLVTETEFSDGSVSRITEKIVKPFCLGHPCLVVGNPGSVRFMTELGFRDWDGLINRAYEDERDPPTRFGLLFDEVMRQASLVRADPASWLARAREAGAANICHATSGQFLVRYSELYDRPVVARLAALVGA